MRFAQKVRLGSAVVVSLIIGVTLVTQASAAAPPPPGTRAPGNPTPPSRAWLDNQKLGFPAIRPHAVRGSAAAFTASDVIQWVNAHGACCQVEGGRSYAGGERRLHHGCCGEPTHARRVDWAA
jgi:hypothetical protein